MHAACHMQNRRTDDPTEVDRSASYSLRNDSPARQDDATSAKAFDWKSTSYRAKANECEQIRKLLTPSCWHVDGPQ